MVIPDDIPEIKLLYTGFTVSFNPAQHQPNYSAWELTRTETEGQHPRSNKFKADTDVYGCASLDDYRRSGFDRGHMAPAADMKWSPQAMDDSHYLTNVCPQSNEINTGRWATIEKMCRRWAQRDSNIIIIAGPVLSDVMPQSIGKNRVPVPRRFFKVIMSPNSNPPYAVGFIVPNQATDQGVEALSCTVDDVEAITGFDFFSSLPDEIESQMESKNSYRYLNRRR